MTTYSKRRGRRSLAAILAAMLMASVLAVVAASPAQAANTSFEVLVDSNSDGTPDAREFAGQDRYDTALRLAKNFAASKGGLGSVPSVFVSSGETLIDSISVAGLAGYTDAPILLTRSGSLHGQVANFIEDYGVDTVYVLGGMAAVSDATVTAIEGLSTEPTVTRIAGDDRYATAAAAAEMIDTDASWCGTDAVSAVLINGSTDALSFGVAVQTIAFRLQLPVLMTPSDELSDAAANFIEMNDVEHVQIIGGTGTVSADVASALTSLGVDTVGRVEGDSAAAVSVALAKLATNGCRDSLGLVSTKRVALVRGNPDGVTSAPVLASSLDNGSLVPPLVVGDSLPASVRDYLAATPKNVGTDKLDLGIVAVGGTAAISADTMSAATAAAASSGALSVTLAGGDNPTALGDGTNPDEGDTNGDGVANADDPVRPGMFVSLYFSDDVPDAGDAGTAPNAALLRMVRDVIEVNGIPARVTAVSTEGAGGSCLARRVKVTLGSALKAGDTVSVAASAHKFGRDADQRTLAASTATVQAPPADRSRPTMQIVGIAEASTPKTGFTVKLIDDKGLSGTTVLADAEVTVVAGPGGTAVPSPTVAHDPGTDTATVALGRALVVGDRLIIKPGAIEDNAVPKANVSAGTSATAIKAQASPRINQIRMSELKHSLHNVWTVPSSGNPFGPAVASGGAAVLRISAKASGDAAGAAGNDWDILLDTATGYSAAKPLDIDVRVDTRGKRVSVRWVNGKATIGDLLAALRADSAFDERFSAGVTPCTAPMSTPLTQTAASRNVLATSADAGRTQFAIEVQFNAYIRTVDHAELVEDLLFAAANRAGKNNDATAETGIQIAAVGGSVAADGAITPGIAGGGLEIVADDQKPITDGETRIVRYEGTTALVANLPMARDLVETKAGHQGAATAITGPPAYTAIAPPVPAVATGYAADVTTPGATDNADDASDRVDEDKNGDSQRRIAVSSSVKAR